MQTGKTKPKSITIKTKARPYFVAMQSMSNMYSTPQYEMTQPYILEFPLTPMGVLAPGSAHTRPSAQPPIDVSGNFPASVSADKFSMFSPPIYHTAGVGGGGDGLRLFYRNMRQKISLAPMGVLAPVSAHAGPSAQPLIDTTGNFPAHMSAEWISPNFPIFRSK